MLEKKKKRLLNPKARKNKRKRKRPAQMEQYDNRFNYMKHKWTNCCS